MCNFPYSETSLEYCIYKLLAENRRVDEFLLEKAQQNLEEFEKFLVLVWVPLFKSSKDAYNLIDFYVSHRIKYSNGPLLASESELINALQFQRRDKFSPSKIVSWMILASRKPFQVTLAPFTPKEAKRYHDCFSKKRARNIVELKSAFNSLWMMREFDNFLEEINDDALTSYMTYWYYRDEEKKDQLDPLFAKTGMEMRFCLNCSFVLKQLHLEAMNTPVFTKFFAIPAWKELYELVAYNTAKMSSVTTIRSMLIKYFEKNPSTPPPRFKINNNRLAKLAYTKAVKSILANGVDLSGDITEHFNVFAGEHENAKDWWMSILQKDLP